MAEYYPLLAKAVGSLPNSTPETRRVVYERARKALIGQLRTLHPPVPDDDIEAESVALDRAIERIEAELATGGIASPAASPTAAAPPAAPSSAAPPSTAPSSTAPSSTGPSAAASKSAAATKPRPPKSSSGTPAVNGNGSAAKSADKRPAAPLRTKTPKPPAPVSDPKVSGPEARPGPGDIRPAQTGGRPMVVEVKGPETKPSLPDATRRAPAGTVEPGDGPPRDVKPANVPPLEAKSTGDVRPGDAPPVEAKPSAPPRVMPSKLNGGNKSQSGALVRAEPAGDKPAGDKAAGDKLAGDRGAPAEAETPPATADATASKPLRSDGPRIEPVRSDPQRPIAPQPPVAKGPKRRLWILPVAIAFVVGAVAVAAWKLRDHPETIAKSKPADTAPADTGKIAERVNGPTNAPAPAPGEASKPDQGTQPSTSPEASTNPASSPSAPGNNPEVPVAHRAALLVEAPNEPNKVKTFLGTVVWKLNNTPQGPSDSVGLAVEADIDLPEDRMKAIVTFAKNTEPSLPASHTINVRFVVDAGSYTGDVKQISVPQMRPESSPSGEALAGVTVQIVPNAFLVGLSPGNAENANVDLMRRLQWIDIPMLLDSGKIAKLTFEKSESGMRDLDEAFDTWQKP